jgi:ribosomal protein S18 acetylase RimI-like enzyme
MMDAVTYHRLDDDNAHLLQGADVFDNAVDADQLANFLEDAGHELVFARQGETVIGFASGVVLLHPDKQPAFFINEVDVVPDFQRQGIGKALCERLMELARTRGCKGIWLATEGANHPAQALYKSLEGRETKDIVVYDWHGAMDD